MRQGTSIRERFGAGSAVLLMVGLLPVFSACQDSFMKQSTANKMGAITTLQTTVDEAGNVVAQIDPTRAETQVMRITDGNLAGAALAVPPTALSIPVTVMVGEGVSLTSVSFNRSLGLTENKITAGGPSVSFTPSTDVVASSPLTLSIPFGALSFALADVDTENLIVMYRWTTIKNGEPTFEVGIIPGDQVTRGRNKVSFQTTKFGTFQVGLAETKIAKPLLAATDEPPALKSCERYAAAVFPPCTMDGQLGCVTNMNFKAADMTLAKSEYILTGRKMADVTGNVILPAVGKVLSGTQFGVSGTGSTGTLTLPLAADVLQGSSPYGDPGEAVTPTLADRGMWDLRSAFPGAGYYSGTTNAPTAGDIRSGATVAGVTGQYPSSSFRLTNSSGTDLTSSTFDAQIKSSAAFQYFGSDGTRYIGAGDSDILDSNIKSGVSIFGANGNASTANPVLPDPWDVRVGTTVNGIQNYGKLKVSCRNRANLSIFDYNSGSKSASIVASSSIFSSSGHGLANGQPVVISSSALSPFVQNTTYFVIVQDNNQFQLAPTAGGAAITATTAGNITLIPTGMSTADVWDTIDDFNGNNSGLPPSLVVSSGGFFQSWGTNTDCMGVDTAASSTDDDNVWKDVTTTNGTTASTCTATPANCTMQDKITGLSWSKLQSTAQAWNTAWATCVNLTYNGQTGWRLPTQKELMEAYTHGIRSVPSSYAAANTTWIPEAQMGSNVFWSGTSTSWNAGSNAYQVHLTKGFTQETTKTTSQVFSCVRGF